MCVSSGYSGTRGGYTGYSQYAPYSTANPTASHAGGLTEEEQIQATIRNSLNDRGQTNQREAPPPYGFHLSEEATAEEIRQRRLMRFDSWTAGQRKGRRRFRLQHNRGISSGSLVQTLLQQAEEEHPEWGPPTQSDTFKSSVTVWCFVPTCLKCYQTVNVSYAKLL